MFLRLAEQYRSVVNDLVMSLEALASSLQARGLTASCYTCGDADEILGASFVAGVGENHLVRFLVSDFGISWVESRDGHELVKLEGAEAIQELQRLSASLQIGLASSSLNQSPTQPSRRTSKAKPGNRLAA